MSKKIALASALPADEVLNGLDHIAEDLDLDSRIAAFVVFEVSEIKMTKAGEVPKVRIFRVEPLGAPASVDPRIAELVLQASEHRTGADPLPLDAVVAPTSHPDVCDHHWATETEDIEDVPAGMERRTCLRCGYQRFVTARDVDDAETDDAAAEEEDLFAGDPTSLAARIDDVAAVVPADADDAVVRPFRKAR